MTKLYVQSICRYFSNFRFSKPYDSYLLLCGLISSYLFNEKGRNWLVWLITGFLTGPIGLILILLWPKDQKTLDQKALFDGELKKCPDCAELVKSEASKCRFCGADLDKNETIIEINPDKNS